MGGSVAAKSEVGIGTSFNFCISTRCKIKKVKQYLAIDEDVCYDMREYDVPDYLDFNTYSHIYAHRAFKNENLK